MIKFFVKIILQFFFWKPKAWRKGLKANLESRLYSIAIRRRAKKCGKGLYILGPGVNVTSNTIVGPGVGFGKNVKISGDGPVVIGWRAAIAEDTIIYTQVHDYDHSNTLPFGWGFTYPETRIDDFAWIGLRSIVLPGAHIGEGAIVQAGSVVMGNVPPCAIVAGNPAKVIGYRDVEHYNKLKVMFGGKPVELPGEKVKGERGKAKGERGLANDLSAKAGERLDDVFCSVFSVTPDEAHAMSYKDHPAWDSAGQMALVAALEREFGVSVSPEDIYRLRSYDDALALVASHQAPTANYQLPTNQLPTNQLPTNQLPATNFFDLDRDGIAVVCDGREISFRELKAMGERAIAGIRPRSVRFVKAGTTPEKIDPALYDKLHALYADATVHDDLAFLISTSGSTGSPKLVRHSYANFRADNMYAAADHHLSAADRFLIPLPLCYAFGIQVMGACLTAGTAIVITSKSIMDSGFGDVLEQAKATHFVGVPYMYEMLDRLGFFARPFPSLKNLSISGGALGPALRRKYAEWARDTGRIFCEIYGQTETLAYMAKLETNDHLDKIGSIGQASSAGRFSLKGSGELVYHGPIVAMGYATCAADLLKGDEWKGVRETGDMATIDAEGYVTLTGRASRFIKVFGNRVSLQDVENILKDAFPAASIAATGADNDLHVFATQVSAEEVERLLVAKLHFNSTVMKTHALDAMPLNANGKTDYQKLTRIAAESQSSTGNP